MFTNISFETLKRSTYIKANQMSTKMETIINNPGLQHLAEKVFLNLDVEDLKNCEHINQSCKQILENPMFWLKRFGGSLSKKNEKDWVKIIQSVKSFVYEKLILSTSRIEPILKGISFVTWKKFNFYARLT